MGLKYEQYFLKPTYFNIFELISKAQDNAKKIKKVHLKYAIINNYAQKYKRPLTEIRNVQEFFEIEKYKDMFTKTQNDLLSNNDKVKLAIQLDTHFLLSNIDSQGLVDTEEQLDHYVHTLKNNGLIDTRPSKKGHSYFIITKKGIGEYQRFFLKKRIETATYTQLDKIWKCVYSSL